MKIVGASVNCGGHTASNCGECTQWKWKMEMENGGAPSSTFFDHWLCNGDCSWVNGQCIKKGKGITKYQPRYARAYLCTFFVFLLVTEKKNLVP